VGAVGPPDSSMGTVLLPPPPVPARACGQGEAEAEGMGWDGGR
jgi:hypothetical protein